MSIDWKKMTSMDIKDLVNIQIGASGAGKLPTHIPDKRGINLVSHEDEEIRRKRKLIILIASAVLLLALLKFGVLDPFLSLAKENKQYKEIHEQYEQAQEELKDLDRVQLEYRSYSMDWLDNDDAGRYVSVSRLTLLDMVENQIMPFGLVTGVNVDGDTMRVTMADTDLQRISEMCAEVEKLPFVASTALQTASMDEVSNTVKFEVDIGLQRPDAKKGD